MFSLPLLLSLWNFLVTISSVVIFKWLNGMKLDSLFDLIWPAPTLAPHPFLWQGGNGDFLAKLTCTTQENKRNLGKVP